MRRVCWRDLFILAAGILCAVRCGGWPFPDVGPSVAPIPAPPLTLGWAEHFDTPVLSWIDPVHRRRDVWRRIYRVERKAGGAYLCARHDARLDQEVPPARACHYGQRFDDRPIPLERVGELSWKWRVWQHPQVDRDPWLDLAASIYFVIVPPTIFQDGTGFKFGWLAGPGPSGTRQRGLVQIPVRHGGTAGEWQLERVDPCILYRQFYGPCEGASVTYIGVISDADNTHSVAAADYADFELLLRQDVSARSAPDQEQHSDSEATVARSL